MTHDTTTRNRGHKGRTTAPVRGKGEKMCDNIRMTPPSSYDRAAGADIVAIFPGGRRLRLRFISPASAPRAEIAVAVAGNTRSHNADGAQLVGGYIVGGQAYQTTTSGGYAPLTEGRAARMRGQRRMLAEMLLGCVRDPLQSQMQMRTLWLATQE